MKSVALSLSLGQFQALMEKQCFLGRGPPGDGLTLRGSRPTLGLQLSVRCVHVLRGVMLGPCDLFPHLSDGTKATSLPVLAGGLSNPRTLRTGQPGGV